MTQKSFNLGVLAAMRHPQFHHTGNLLPETDAARAVNATAHFPHGHQGASVLDGNHALLFLVTRGRTTVPDCEILQLAFTTLVTDRTIKWMINKQKFHDGLLRLDRLVALGPHDHALGHRRGASRHRLGHLLHVDQTHTAVGSNAQLLVVAEVRDISARLFSRMHDHAARCDVYFFAVEFNFNHRRIRSNVGRDHTGLMRYMVFKFMSEVLDHCPHGHG